jgi:hypothetical protein
MADLPPSATAVYGTVPNLNTFDAGSVFVVTDTGLLRYDLKRTKGGMNRMELE